MGQHYVARFYLREWANSGKLCYLNLRNRKICLHGLRGIANEKHFYQLHNLTQEEIEILERVLIEPCPEPLRSMQRRFLQLYTLVPRLRAEAQQSNLPPYIRDNMDDFIANAAERRHCDIENCLKPFVHSMLAGDVSFYADRAKVADFIYAICVQFTRTKRAREDAVAIVGNKYQNCNPVCFWHACSYIVAASLGHSLYIDRERMKLVLLDNGTPTPFITSDQPIINLHSTGTDKAPEKLEFFYPLSPTKAMLLVEESNWSDGTQCAVNEIVVNRYNVLMLKNAHEQVFSNSIEYLETIKMV